LVCWALLWTVKIICCENHLCQCFGKAAKAQQDKTAVESADLERNLSIVYDQRRTLETDFNGSNFLFCFLNLGVHGNHHVDLFVKDQH
jgi:hypothetical protein